jgi:hypothetical protein
MLQAIEVIVEPSGLIRPLEKLHVKTPTKAVLTLLETPQTVGDEPVRGSGAAVLALLDTPRFANRPPADAAEIEQRIQDLRNDWDDE